MPNIVLDYKYYLTNVKWTDDYNDVLCFSSKTNRDNYFGIPAIFEGLDTVNFNITNLYKTTIVIDSSADYLRALQSNYIIIQKTGDVPQYFFYFIKNAKQCNYNRLELSIELDLFQQFWYDAEFVKDNINRCKYPINDNSLYILNYNTIPHNIEDLHLDFKYYNGFKANFDLNTPMGILSTIVHGWAYVFVDPSYDFELYDFDNTQSDHALVGYSSAPDGQHGIYNHIGCLCFPIYSSSDKIKLNITDSGNTSSFVLGDASNVIERLKSGHNGADAAHIYTIKISRRMPFAQSMLDASLYGGKVGIDHVFNFNGSLLNDEFYIIDPDGTSRPPVSVIDLQLYKGLRIVTDKCDTYEYQFNFGNVNINIKGTTKYSVNTKLESQYTKRYIDFGDGNKMEFDLTRSIYTFDQYGAPIMKLFYKEAITPDISRYVVSIDSPWYDGYGEGINYASETFTSDMTMIFTLDQWAEYLANNKNFYAQGNFNAMMKFNKQTVSGAASANLLNPTGMAAKLANMYADALQFTKNREFQVDNLQSAVDRVINQNGSAIFNLLLHGIQPACVTTNLDFEDQSRVIKYLQSYGVSSVGLFDDIKAIDPDDTDSMLYLNGKEFKYAFIQSDVKELKNPDLSLECEKDFLRIFNKGVRFWFDPATMYNFEV